MSKQRRVKEMQRRQSEKEKEEEIGGERKGEERMTASLTIHQGQMECTSLYPNKALKYPGYQLETSSRSPTKAFQGSTFL